MEEFYKAKSTNKVNNNSIMINEAKEWLKQLLLTSDNYIIDRNTLDIEINNYIKQAQENLTFLGVPVFIISWKKTINKVCSRRWIDEKLIIKNSK